MKKIIETDLVSIAHKILQIKDKSEVSALLEQTEKLYQKLVLLKFYEDNKFRLDASITEEVLFAAAQESNKEIAPKEEYMSEEIVNELLEESEKDEVMSFEEEIITPQPQNLTTEEDMEQDETEPEEEIIFTPSVEETTKTIDEIEEDIEEIEQLDPAEAAKEAVERVTLEIDPVFSVPHEELFMTDVQPQKTTSVEMQEEQPESEIPHLVSVSGGGSNKIPFHQIPLNKTINDAFNNTIVVGLNDRIAFEKNLFNGRSEDLNRTISHLNTVATYQEAKDFIEDLVKPDFNNWKGKDEYEQRFMQLVEKRFL